MSQKQAGESSLDALGGAGGIVLKATTLDHMLEAMSAKEKKGINPWVQILIVPITVALISTVVTYWYNRQQEEINRIQTMEEFVAYFSGGHSTAQQIAALITMVQLGYRDLAADFLVFTLGGESPQTQSAVQPFVMSHGRELLPRLCHISLSARQGGPVKAAHDYAQIAIEREDGFTTLTRLATSPETDDVTREGALGILNEFLFTYRDLLQAEPAVLSGQSNVEDLFRNNKPSEWITRYSLPLQQDLEHFVLSAEYPNK